MDNNSNITGCYEEFIKKEIQQTKLEPRFADEKLWYPLAKELSPLALKRFKAGKSDNIDKLVPIYLYPEDCQVQK